MRVVFPTLVSLALLALVLPASFATSHTDFPDRAHHASWSTPLDFTGDLTIRFTVDFGEANQCSSFIGAATGGPEGGVRYRMSGAHFGITGWSGRPAHVATADVDTRTLTTMGGGGFRMTSTGPLSGVHDVTMTVFNAKAIRLDSPDPWFPLQWALGCDQPFAITDKQGGREALGFTQLAFQGTSASADAWLAAASINQEGHVSATFTAPDVTLHWFSYGSIQGRLSVHEDDGTTSWDLSKKSRATYTAAPGEITITLDRLGGGLYDDLVGVMIGTGPVASFDDVL